MSSPLTDQSQTQSAMTSPSPTNTDAPPANIGAIVGAVVGVLAIVAVVIGIYLWYHLKRRKQSHSFPETPTSGDHPPTFRALSTWEEAITNQQKQKDVSEYTSVQRGYSTPDLIAGTNDSDIIQNNQYGRLRNETIISETSDLPTFDEISERPLSVGFDNPGFDIGLDEILDSSIFNGPVKLDRESSREEESDHEHNERTLTQSPTDLEQNVSIITTDPPDETTIESHNEEDDHVSTKERELSDDVNAAFEDVSQKIEEMKDTDSEDIEKSHNNTVFRMGDNTDATGTPPESPTTSSDIGDST